MQDAARVSDDRSRDAAPVPEPQLPAEVAVRSFSEVRRGYDRSEAVREAERIGDLGLEYLQDSTESCPFGVDLRGLVDNVRAGDFDGALAVVSAAHPWPGIMGRHCPKFCEQAFARHDPDTKPALALLERAAADYGSQRVRPDQAGSHASPSGRHEAAGVAIVGAGSAGSAVAYRLRALGHRVSVFDALPRGGGMMWAGYPEFRLPVDLLDRENDLDAWGVVQHYNVRVDRPLFEQLTKTYDAVVVASGLYSGVLLNIPGEEGAGVQSALDFLTRLKAGEQPPIGERVAIFGAGYTAQDASRTCVRLGAEVKIYYRRGKREMPIDDAYREIFLRRLASEGIEYVFYSAPRRIVREAGRVVGVECSSTRRAGDGTTPSAAPDVIPGTEFFVPCDTVLRATGEVADLSFLPEDVRRLEGRQIVAVDRRSWMTSVPGVFAVGSVAGTARTASAFASGLAAGESISAYLRNKAT